MYYTCTFNRTRCTVIMNVLRITACHKMCKYTTLDPRPACYLFILTKSKLAKTSVFVRPGKIKTPRYLSIRVATKTTNWPKQCSIYHPLLGIVHMVVHVRCQDTTNHNRTRNFTFSIFDLVRSLQRTLHRHCTLFDSWHVHTLAWNRCQTSERNFVHFWVVRPARMICSLHHPIRYDMHTTHFCVQ